MPSSHVAFDRKSGRIVAVHHGSGDPEHARQLVHKYVRFGAYPGVKRRATVGEGDLAVISVPADAFKSGKQYKVDVNRNALVEVDAGGEGVGASIVSVRR